MNNTRERQVYIAAVIYTLSLFIGGNSIGATSFFFFFFSFFFFPITRLANANLAKLNLWILSLEHLVANPLQSFQEQAFGREQECVWILRRKKAEKRKKKRE